MKMSETFKALVLRQEGGKVRHAIEQLTVNDLPERDVLVAVDISPELQGRHGRDGDR